MVDVNQAAKMLGVSRSRVRALLKTGQLEGEKIGNAWAVSETSLAKRMLGGTHPGRPAKTTTQARTFKHTLPDVETAHKIYDEAAHVLVGCYSSAFLDQARTSEEQAFWIHVADFFLQQKQRELIKAGVY